MKDTGLIERSAELKNRDNTLWEKIKSYLSDLLDKVRALYSRFTPDSYEGNYVRNMRDSIQKIHEMWVNGALSAIESYNNAETGENTEEKDIRYSERNNYDKALDRSEWRAFYQTLSGDNSSASNAISQIGVYLPNSNKLIVYNGDRNNPIVKAVYNLGDYEYNIHDGIDNIIELFVNRLELTEDESYAEAILQEYSAQFGTLFTKYRKGSAEFVELSREDITNRETDRQEPFGRGVSERDKKTQIKNSERIDYDYGDLFERY